MRLEIIMLVFLSIPPLLTLWNGITILTFLIRKKERKINRWVEILTNFLGLSYLALYLHGGITDITLEDWNVQLINSQIHSMIYTETFPTIGAVFILSLIGYLVLRFVPAEKQPPLVSAFAMAATYCGILLCVVWCIQTKQDIFLVLYPANYILILLKTVLIFTIGKGRQIQKDFSPNQSEFPEIHSLLNKALNLPWIGLILILPLMGILITILVLFGQEPSSVIKAWTETADWTLSQKIPPQNIYYDEHYLCTVAAGGHRKIVKPLRVGIRHGHRVLVNRQLCVANAFEQILEEKIPAVHKVVRGIYDRTGYPLARHIRSKWTADIIYFLMKPLEWLFLLVIYSVDTRPEDRIAVQYPHTKPPKSESPSISASSSPSKWYKSSNNF